jgi:hypothetical protein
MATRIIALWAVPRSVSTPFERMFAERGDTTVVHEPFTECFYFSDARASARYGDAPEFAGYDGPRAVEEIRRAAGRLVFVKDLAFQAAPYVPRRFLGSITNTFIVRHPLVVLASLRELKPDFTEAELGFLPLLELWTAASDLGGGPPVVVEGDAFRAEPARVARAYCERVGIEFDPTMLTWADGRIRPWLPHERESQAKWHATLERSRGILPPAAAASPPDIVDEAHEPMYRRALEVYERVAANAL